MYLPPCLSLVMALVPTAQEPTDQTPDPWIAYSPDVEISAIDFHMGEIKVLVVDATTGALIRTEYYDELSYPGGHAKPTRVVPPDSDKPIVGAAPDIRKYLKTIEHHGSQIVVSDNDLSAIEIDQADSAGGTGQVTFYTLLKDPKAPQQRTRVFPEFVNANLSTDGETIYVQLAGYLQQWGWGDFLGDGKPIPLAVTGQFTDVWLPGSNKQSTYPDYFMLQSHGALEVYKGVQTMPGSVDLPPGWSGTVPLKVEVGRVNTQNYATSAHMDGQTGYVLVTDREQLFVRRVVEGNQWQDLGGLQVTDVSYGLQGSPVEIRSSCFTLPSANGVAGEALVVAIGLIRKVVAPKMGSKGHCEVAAWVLDANPAAKAKPVVKFKTPWLHTERWNRVSPSLYLTKDNDLLFLSTRSQVWRFKVQS